MARTRPPPTLRAELAAALGVLALLLQALLPAAALAAQARGGEPVVICTLAGPHAVVADAAGSKPGKGFAGLPCQDCLTCAAAALPTPEPQALPVRYAIRMAETPRPHELGPSLARAPPRPPGQGPPQA